MNRSPRESRNPSDRAKSGDGGNRTHATFPTSDPDTLIRGWALALRDLADQGAVSVSATFEGGGVMTYTIGRGCVLAVAGRLLEIPEAALDDVGLIPADGSESLDRPS